VREYPHTPEAEGAARNQQRLESRPSFPERRALDSRVVRVETATVAAPPQTLEALVKDELRGPVREIVRRLVPELVAETLNGVAAAPVEVEPASTANGATPAAKVCRSCGVEKSADQFGKGRRVCKACRREQGRAWEDARAARRREQRTHAPAAALDDDEEGPRIGARPAGEDGQSASD
jgi:hypothetical protein